MEGAMTAMEQEVALQAIEVIDLTDSDEEVLVEYCQPVCKGIFPGSLFYDLAEDYKFYDEESTDEEWANHSVDEDYEEEIAATMIISLGKDNDKDA